MITEPLPKPGQVMDHKGTGNRYLVIEARRPERKGDWCDIDLINTRTKVVFMNHTYNSVIDVVEPTDKEAALFAHYTLDPDGCSKPFLDTLAE